jgi:hypothetical protein
MMAENYMVKQGMIQPLTAYHGTPHTIQGQFDINKVGTGEGAQAYGYGMYFAENPAVAKEYQKLGQSLPYEYTIEGKSSKELGYKSPVVEAAYENKLPEFRKKIEERLKLIDVDEPAYAINTKMLKDIEELQGKKIEQIAPMGNLYKVDIPDADIPMMLDYDKPLSQQPKAVQEALAKYDPDMYGPKSADYDSAELGQSIYQRIIQDNVKKFGHGGNQQRTSEQLNALGIKGIRYLDEGSRQAGGTSNFVIFDPSTVKILEKNNKPVTRKELIQEQIDKIE